MANLITKKGQAVWGWIFVIIILVIVGLLLIGFIDFGGQTQENIQATITSIPTTITAGESFNVSWNVESKGNDSNPEISRTAVVFSEQSISNDSQLEDFPIRTPDPCTTEDCQLPRTFNSSIIITESGFYYVRPVVIVGDTTVFGSERTVTVLPTINGNETNGNQTEEPQTFNVDIGDFAFTPQNLTINTGDTVVWTNRDSEVHTVTSNDGDFDSGNLDEGEDYSMTFNEEGTYDYHCTLHPDMIGRIIVE